MLTRNTKADYEYYLFKLHRSDVEESLLMRERVFEVKKKVVRKYNVGPFIKSMGIYERMLSNFFGYCHMPSKQDRVESVLVKLNEYERSNNLPLTEIQRRKGKWRS
jgi:hypothetical protein